MLLKLNSFLKIPRPPPRSTLFPYTTLFRSHSLETMFGTWTGAGPLDTVKTMCRAVVSVPWSGDCARSEEHTSELQSHVNIVCRLLLEKKKSALPVSRLLISPKSTPRSYCAV